jgi:hypothetical protein
MRGGARMAAWQITGLSTALLLLFLNTAALTRGFNGVRPVKTRHRWAPSSNYTPRGGLHDRLKYLFLLLHLGAITRVWGYHTLKTAPYTTGFPYPLLPFMQRHRLYGAGEQGPCAE